MLKYTIGKNNIGEPKVQNDPGAIQSFICNRNHGLFSIAPCKIITLYILCLIFVINSLLFFLMALSTVIAF